MALTLGRLGRHPQLLTSLGEDDRGHAVRAWLEGSGVRVSAGSANGAHTSTATALLDATGAATYEFDPAWTVDVELAGGADVLHVGSIATLLEPDASDVGAEGPPPLCLRTLRQLPPECWSMKARTSDRR